MTQKTTPRDKYSNHQAILFLAFELDGRRGHAPLACLRTLVKNRSLVKHR